MSVRGPASSRSSTGSLLRWVRIVLALGDRRPEPAGVIEVRM